MNNNPVESVDDAAENTGVRAWKWLRPLTVTLLVTSPCWSCALYLLIETVTLESRSPDGEYRAILADRIAGGDRNFKLYLQHVPTRQWTLIYRSPDEGHNRTERIFWTRDSRCFLLVGKSFFIDDEDSIRLPTGEEAYLLYDIATAQCWCAAGQNGRSSVELQPLPQNVFQEVLARHGGVIDEERFEN